MPELLFADSHPIDFIYVPPGALADFLPIDGEQLRSRVANITQHAPMGKLLAIDHDCPYRRLDDQTDNQALREEIGEWREGVLELSGELNALDEYIAPRLAIPGEAGVLEKLLNRAYQEYAAMVDHANVIGRLSPEKATAGLRCLAADLISGDFSRSWMDWNSLAKGYQQRKIRFIDGEFPTLAT